MKKHFILLAISFILLANSHLFAQGPPPPPVDPETGGGPVGGSAPMGSGTMMLLALGGLYVGYKSRKSFRDTDN